MFHSFKRLFSFSPAKQHAHDAYLRIVAGSRNPVFYTDWHVPDTLDGRFDIIVLHMFLVLSACEFKIPSPLVGEGGDPALVARVPGEGGSSNKIPPLPNHPPQGGRELYFFCRALTELFFADMDRSLREMGVGDTGVGKRVKNMAQAFYGRIKAYGQAIDNETALTEILRHNVWREKPVADEATAQLATYMRRNYQSLRAQPVEALLRGQIIFLS